MITENKIKKRKIAFVIESLQLGGAEKCLVTLLNQLDYEKMEVDLILFSKSGVFLDQVPKEVNVIFIVNIKLPLVSRLLYLWKRKINNSKLHNAQILWKINESKFKKIDKIYDIAVAYNQGFATYFTSKYVTSFKKFSWLNIDYELAGYDIEFDYPIYAKFDTIVAVSNEVEDIFRKKLEENGNYKLKTTTIRDIVDEKEILQKASQPLEVKFDDRTINIVSVGRLAKQKAFDLAIKACAMLIEKGHAVKWYVVGEGGERPYLENLIKNYKLTDTFFLMGLSKNPYPYVSQATIFVQTSIFEGLGSTVLEAKVLNKPIVSTNFPSIYSMIQHDQTGLIAEMSPESIAAQIERLILDRSLRDKFSKNLLNGINSGRMDSMQKINELFNI